MRLYTMSLYRPEPLTDVDSLYSKIIKPLELSMIIDIRYNNSKCIDFTKESNVDFIKQKGCNYLYVGDMFIKKDKIAKDKKYDIKKLEQLSETEILFNEDAKKVLDVICSSIQKFNTCILGSGIKPKRDNRSLIAYIVKNYAKQKGIQETIYVMHIGG